MAPTFYFLLKFSTYRLLQVLKYLDLGILIQLPTYDVERLFMRQ